MKNLVGILLVNLGTPDSAAPRDVYRYLNEFLTDGRVIDLPWLQRQLLVRGLIVPFRFRQSAASYQRIWTEQGSPLMVYGKRVEALLQQALGDQYKVKLAMRYRIPSIQEGVQALMDAHVEEIIVVPLFPQYASATTGSVHQRVMETLKDCLHIPKLSFINNFASHPAFIEAFASTAQGFELTAYDHVLFSYHSLPKRHLTKADRRDWCLKADKCCERKCLANAPCYSAQCYATTAALVKRLGLKQGQYSLSFQSRLGKDPWQQPYTSDVIAQLAKNGKKKVLVFCPSFVSDCLETIFEIGEEYAAEFKHAGGHVLHLVPGLNDRPEWITALREIVLSETRSEAVEKS